MRLLLLIALVQGDAPKRLQQTTYALKAAARGGLVIGVEARDGCIICAASSEAKGPSWASLDKGAATEKVHKVAPHAAVGVAGLDGDCRSGVKALRNAAVAHWLEFGDRLTLSGLADALADECARHAGLDALLSGADDDDDERSARPLGAAFLLIGVDDASSVWLVDAAASPRRWRAKAIGQSCKEADARLEAEFVVSLNSRRGKPKHDGDNIGVVRQVTSESIASAFTSRGYQVAARHGRPFAPPQAELLILRRRR